MTAAGESGGGQIVAWRVGTGGDAGAIRPMLTTGIYLSAGAWAPARYLLGDLWPTCRWFSS